MLPRSSVIQETRMFDSEPLKRTQIEDNASSCIKISYLRNVHVNAAIPKIQKSSGPPGKSRKPAWCPRRGWIPEHPSHPGLGMRAGKRVRRECVSRPLWTEPSCMQCFFGGEAMLLPGSLHAARSVSDEPHMTRKCKLKIHCTDTHIFFTKYIKAPNSKIIQFSPRERDNFCFGRFTLFVKTQQQCR